MFSTNIKGQSLAKTIYAIVPLNIAAVSIFSIHTFSIDRIVCWARGTGLGTGFDVGGSFIAI